jgi:hypothetical protein
MGQQGACDDDREGRLSLRFHTKVPREPIVSATAIDLAQACREKSITDLDATGDAASLDGRDQEESDDTAETYGPHDGTKSRPVKNIER